MGFKIDTVITVIYDNTGRLPREETFYDLAEITSSFMDSKLNIQICLNKYNMDTISICVPTCILITNINI